jgi:hypothetical protein
MTPCECDHAVANVGNDLTQNVAGKVHGQVVLGTLCLKLPFLHARRTRVGFNTLAKPNKRKHGQFSRPNLRKHPFPKTRQITPTCPIEWRLFAVSHRSDPRVSYFLAYRGGSNRRRCSWIFWECPDLGFPSLPIPDKLQ